MNQNNYKLNPKMAWLTGEKPWLNLRVQDLSPLDRASLIDQIESQQYVRTLATVLSMMQQQPYEMTQREHLLFAQTLQQVVDELMYIHQHYALKSK